MKASQAFSRHEKQKLSSLLVGNILLLGLMRKAFPSYIQTRNTKSQLRELKSQDKCSYEKLPGCSG